MDNEHHDVPGPVAPRRIWHNKTLHCTVFSMAWVLCLAAAAVTVGYVYLLWAIDRPLRPRRDLYVLEAGDSIHDLASLLVDRGAIREPLSLVLWARVTGQAARIKAGEYQFFRGETLRQMLDAVVEGRVATYRLLLLEGWTFHGVRQELKQTSKLKHKLHGLSDAEAMTKLGLSGIDPEGRFFPDTYHYAAGETDVAILQKAYWRMQSVLAEEWSDRDPTVPWTGPYETLIVASIIEREARAPAERPIISAVFINRLKRKMRLQTDPTVIYGLGDDFDGALSRSDLRRDTPYNTYTRPGLPPTPIAMPGRAAIHAALHPAASKMLYFMARGDGTHQFSRTLKQHNAAVRKYRIK